MGFALAWQLAGVLGLVAGCRPSAAEPPAVAAAVSAPVSAEPAQAVSDPALALPAVERSRLLYALESAKLLSQEWPWLVADETCVLLIAPAKQWIANCAITPDEFSAAGPELFGKPVYGRASESLLLADGQSTPTAEFIKVVPATAYWKPAKDAPEGTLVPWIMASSLEALTASHPGFDAKTPTEEWLSVFLHEFFHTRQLIHPGFRKTLAEIWTPDFKHQREALEQAFGQDAEFRAQLDREYALLSRAAAQDAALSPEAARKVLGEWSARYDERLARLRRAGGEPRAHADVVLTYVEGIARYVETQFLSDARFHATVSLASDAHYEGFRRFSAPGYQGLANRGMAAPYFYAIGFHLGLVLDRCDPTWKARVAEAPDWVVGLARSAVSG